MYVLIEEGSAIRPPIGSVTFRNVPIEPKPSAEPASRYCRGTASNPARKFSVLNAPPQIVTESQATVNASSRMPTWGSAKKSMKIWIRIGVFRITST